MEAGLTVGALRALLRRAAPGSFGSTRVAPLLCGALRTFLPSGDPESMRRLRRELIAPTERFRTDAALWAPHARVKAFVRKHFLDSQYRGTERYKRAVEVLRSEALPSRRQVFDLFGLGNWRRGRPEDEHARKRALLRSLAEDDDTSGLSLEDVIEVAGGCVSGRNEFNSYCENHEIYDILTREFVNALAAVVRGERRVLEVGAGDGRLSHHLRECGVDCVATDSGGWRIPRRFPVEGLDVEAALAKHRPSVVLASWMPSGDDWTAAIRATPSVDAYVLVGEVDAGACGHPWRTWGYEEEEEERSHGPSPPYEVDGFDRAEATECSALQLCRYDCEAFVGNSKTTVFRRRSMR